MRSSGHRRTRILAAGSILVAVSGVIGFTQFAQAEDTPSTKAAKESGAGKVVGNNLTILTDTCIDSQLPPHDGFQKGDRCVSTEFGEVGEAANNPTLLITEAPRNVTAGTPFTLQVSTRNLIRDRFLAAGQGGYYVESSVLQNGLVRGHFHSACRMLSSTDEAPDPAPVPAFFVATEDSRGGAAPDTVTIRVPGLPEEGIAQCSSWAGDGSHRVPMMQRANQTPAFDSVRITVNDGGNTGGGDNDGGNTGGGDNDGGNTGGGDNDGGNTGGGDNDGGNTGGGDNDGGNTGGGDNDGGNTGGGDNDGGNTGGGDNGGVTPTAPATTSPAVPKPNTTVVTPKATTVTPRTNSTTKNTEERENEGTSSSNNDSSGSNNSSDENQNENNNDNNGSEATESEETVTPKSTTKKAKPQPTETETDGPALADDGAPDDYQYDSGSTDKTVAEPPAEQSGPLALISNNLAWIGGGAVLLLGALIAVAFARSRPRNTWR